MKDGRQTDVGDEAQPADKVVRLPRDWLGPREDLVPFGRRTAEPEPESSPPRPSPEAPPSAADFWGERSAAIHGALQAPAEVPADAGDPVAPPKRRPLFGGIARRRVAAGAALAVAGIAAVFLAFAVLGPAGSPSHHAGTPRLNVAAVLSDGVSRSLQHGLELLGASARQAQPPPAAHRHAPAVRRTVRPRRVSKPKHETAHPHAIATANSVSPASRDIVTSSPPATTHTYTHTTVSDSSRTSSPTRSSSARVSPTGDSGALGPIQSPNG